MAVDVGSPALRRDTDFRRYWLARSVSIGGSMVTYVVLPVLVYRLTGSSVWTGLTAAAESLPYLCFGLVAGALADRVDRKRLMVGTDIASALLLLSVPAAYLLGVLTAAHAVAVGFAVNTLFVFFDAANFGALPTLAGRQRLASATSAVYGSSTLLELSVPAAAGAALAVVAPAPLLIVDALSFVGSALLIRAVRQPLKPPPGGSSRLVGQIREGLRFLVDHPVVRIQTVIAVAVCMASGVFTGQLVPWADKVLHVSPGDWRLGPLFAAWGVGGLLASIVFPPIARAVGEIRVTLLTLPLSAALGLLVAASPTWLFATLAVAAWAVPVMTLILNAVTLRAKVTPDRLQARVNTAGRMIGFGLGTPLGAVAGGLVAQAYGARPAMSLAPVLLAVAAAIAWLSPLRLYRRDPAMVAAPAP
jgi:predicted MFS family arabinose efflux permease